jgi:hypothetical protein
MKSPTSARKVTLMIPTVRNTSLADRGFMNVSHLAPAEIHEPVMQLAPEDRRDRDKVNKAVRRWGTSGSLRYDGAVRMPGSSTQASRANHA